MKNFSLWLLLTLLFTACTPATSNIAATTANPLVTVYLSPTWGCCGDWTTYMEDNGFPLDIKDTLDLSPIKTRYQVPVELHSCHTAIVDGYVVEGHVPVEFINQMLTERPDIIGIAVPGMPLGSPGMEVDGAAPQPYDVISWDQAGQTAVFAHITP